MATKVRLALCGAGRIGAVHLTNLLANRRVSLTTIIESEKVKCDETAKENGCHGFTTLAEALEYEKLHGALFEGIVICTPTYTHTDLIREALTANKHVLCEKPLGHDVETIDGLYELAKSQNHFLLCGFHRRYEPTFMKVREAIKAGACGQLYKVKTVSRDNPVPSLEYLKISGGIVHDCASHDIDTLRWMIGAEPITVYTCASTFNSDIKALDDFDVLEIVFRFPGGILGTTDITRKAIYGYDQRIEAVGDMGIVRADNQPRSSFVVGDIDGFKHDALKYSFPTRYVEAYQGELEHFVDLCLGLCKEPMLSGQDLHNITRILDAAAESAKTGAVITIDYS